MKNCFYLNNNKFKKKTYLLKKKHILVAITIKQDFLKSLTYVRNHLALNMQTTSPSTWAVQCITIKDVANEGIKLHVRTAKALFNKYQQLVC